MTVWQRFIGVSSVRIVSLYLPWLLYLVISFQLPMEWSCRLPMILLLVGWTVGMFSKCWGWRKLDSVAAFCLAALGGVLLGLASVDLVAAGFVPIDAGLVLIGLMLLMVSATAKGRVQSNILLVIASSFLTLALVEWGLRATGAYQRLSGDYNFDMNMQFHHSYRPYQSGIRHPNVFDDFPPIVFETNSLGMRGPEPEPRPNTVLILGDSYIQAIQVDFRETVGQVLQSRLRQMGLDIAVISQGVGSWSPLLEWNWYLKVGRQFHPREVFVFTGYNDYDPYYRFSDAYYLESVNFDAQGRPESFRLPNFSSFAHRWVRKLQTVMFLRFSWLRVKAAWSGNEHQTLAGLHNASLPLSDDMAKTLIRRQLGDRSLLGAREVENLLFLPDREFEEQLDAFNVREAWARGFWRLQRPLRLWPDAQLAIVGRSEAILRRFAADVEKDGGKLVLVYVPAPFQVGPKECSLGRYHYGIGDGVVVPAISGMQEWLTQRSAQFGVTFLDLTESMRRAVIESGNGSLYTRYDCHWSKLGHRHVADVLFERLAAQNH